MYERIRHAAATELVPAIYVSLKPKGGTLGATTAWGIMVLPHGLPRIGGSPEAYGTGPVPAEL